MRDATSCTAAFRVALYSPVVPIRPDTNESVSEPATSPLLFSMAGDAAWSGCKSPMNLMSARSLCGPMNLDDRVTKREAREAQRIGAITFGCPERVARISGDAKGVRVTATLRPAAKLMHMRTGLACTMLAGSRKPVYARRPRPNEAPAKKSGKMKPPCQHAYIACVYRDWERRTSCRVRAGFAIHWRRQTERGHTQGGKADGRRKGG